MKKTIFFLIVLFILCIPVYAQEIDTQWIQESLNDAQYDTVFGSPGEIINSILNNTFSLNGRNIIENLLELFFASVKKAIPQISGMLGITLILSVIEKLKLLNKNTETIALMGGRIIFSVLLISSSLIFIKEAGTGLREIETFTQVLTPVVVSLLAAAGAQGTVSMLTPSSVLISTYLIEISVNFIFVFIVIGMIISVINGILSDNKLKGFSQLVKSISTWVMGGVFSVFAAIIALQGMTAGVTDGVSIRGLKYALSNSVPVIGGSISESFSAVLTSAYYLKSAAGIMGIIIIVGILAMPVINLMAYVILLKVFSACVQPFADSFVCEQIGSICEFLKLVLIVLFGISILWFIFLGIIVAAGGALL